MPGHRIHDTATMVGSVILAPTTCALAHGLGVEPWPLVGVGALVGGLSGLMLTPDLDVDRGCASYWWARRIMGRALGTLWEWYWYPYGLAMGHRGLSHVPILGTLSRVLYGALWLWPLLLLPQYVSVPWVVALIWVDMLHGILDGIDRATGGKWLN